MVLLHIEFSEGYLSITFRVIGTEIGFQLFDEKAEMMHEWCGVGRVKDVRFEKTQGRTMEVGEEVADFFGIGGEGVRSVHEDQVTAEEELAKFVWVLAIISVRFSELDSRGTKVLEALTNGL